MKNSKGGIMKNSNNQAGGSGGGPIPDISADEKVKDYLERADGIIAKSDSIMDNNDENNIEIAKMIQVQELGGK